MPVAVLTIICLVVAALLAGVYLVTAPEIARQQQLKLEAALAAVLPGAQTIEELNLTDSYPDAIENAYKTDIGYAFETHVKGKENMVIMCGVDNDGKLLNIQVVSEQETPSYKAGVFDLTLGESGVYNGKDSASLEPELVSGATLTSGAIYDAVRASVDGYVIATGGVISDEEPVDPKLEFARSDEEILPIISALVPGSTGFTSVEPDEGYENIVKLYVDNDGNGYVAYLMVVNTRYNRVETETLVHVGSDGKIKNIERLIWKTSDAGWGYVPPEEDAVAAFYDSLIGADLATLKSMYALEDSGDGILVTGATTTSRALVGSIIEGIEANPCPDYTPRVVGIVIIAVALASVCAVVIIKAVRRRKNG